MGNLFFDIETIANPTKLGLYDESVKPQLIPELCQIKAIGAAIDNGAIRVLWMPELTEAEMLEKFWRGIGQHRLIGFNILNFDLPVIFIRSAMLGVTPTRKLDLRPWGNDCIDLYAVRKYCAGSAGLKKIAHWAGIENKAEGVIGDMVEVLTDEQVCHYVTSDVELTRQLYHLYNGFFFN